jgi:hypothetical protein
MAAFQRKDQASYAATPMKSVGAGMENSQLPVKVYRGEVVAKIPLANPLLVNVQHRGFYSSNASNVGAVTKSIKPLSRNSLPTSGPVSLDHGSTARPAKQSMRRGRGRGIAGTKLATISNKKTLGANQSRKGRFSTATRMNSSKTPAPKAIQQRRAARRPYSYIPLTWNVGKGKVVSMRRYA